MLVPGFQPQDVLSVVIGIALGLLTIYRRELSCNRGYHPDDDDENDDPLGDSSHHRRLLRTRALHARQREHSSPSALHEDDSPPRSRGMRRRNSSSALLSPGMMSSFREDERRDSRDANNSVEDPTDELLESAGFMFSGGPFLALAVAVFDHLILTNFRSTFASMRSLLHGTGKRIDTNRTTEDNGDALQHHLEGTHDRNRRTEKQDHLYSVAWNAATEYFTSISSKLDRGLSSNSLQCDNSPSSHPRSQSTGNLLHLSDERSRALLNEMIAMANRGGMDITLLPSDAQIDIFSYLYPEEVLSFTCTNKAGRHLLDDTRGASTNGEENDDDVANHDKSGDTALLVWKALFQRDYCWVLSEWAVGKEAFRRSMSQYDDRGLHRNQLEQTAQDAQRANAGRVFRHIASTIVDPEEAEDLGNGDILAALSSTANRPILSMKEFYFTFTETWLNYTIAGCNSTEKCLIGLHGHVFDISNFVEDHPGSTETLLLQAGRDATVFFESMGHSLGARKLANNMCAVVNGQCARCNFTADEGSNSSAYFQLKQGPLGPPFSTWGLIKPSCKSMDRKLKVTGFLTPRKRSRPRFQGGLHRIRERIRREEQSQLLHAARWESETLGTNGLFGGVHVYYDPFCGWRWWYTDREFNTVWRPPQIQRRCV